MLQLLKVCSYSRSVQAGAFYIEVQITFINYIKWIIESYYNEQSVIYIEVPFRTDLIILHICILPQENILIKIHYYILVL